MSTLIAFPACRAKNPATCRVHGAAAALHRGDLDALLAQPAPSHADRAALRQDVLKKIREPLPHYRNKDEQEFWDDIRKHHKTIAVKGKEFTLAPKGTAGVYCFNCHTYLPEGSMSGSSAATIPCPGCGERIASGLTGISIRHDATRYLDKQNVRDVRWYHSSAHPTWDAAISADEASNTMVHVGTEKAARDRASDLNRSAPTYLYELQLDPDTPIDDRIFEEDLFDDEKISNPVTDYQHDGANRYVNYYENPGSISLYVNRERFKIVNKTRLA